MLEAIKTQIHRTNTQQKKKQNLLSNRDLCKYRMKKIIGETETKEP